MNYRKVVAYSNTCVLFLLDNGYYALVAVDDEEARKLITVSKFAESHMKLAIFKAGAGIDSKTLALAEKELVSGEHVFICKNIPDELRRF